MISFEDRMVAFEEGVSGEVCEIVSWIRQKFNSIGAKGAILGMSGGVDCSVVARLLQEAGIDVLLVKMPYGKSMDFAGDRKDADSFIEKFNFKSLEIDITDAANLIAKNIDGAGINLKDMARANIMPRVRMTTLYSIGQAMGYLVVGTGNKSEITMGYFTKWGDGASDLNPLANFTKTEVRIMAKYLGVPDRIISKAPSANLWENQTDEDEMGMSYADLDEYILTGCGSENAKNKIEAVAKMVMHKNKPIEVYRRFK